MNKLITILIIGCICSIAGCNPQPAVPSPIASPEPITSANNLQETPKPGPTTPQTTVFLEATSQGEGIRIDSGGDVDFEIVTVGEQELSAWRSGNGLILPAVNQNQIEDWYLAFDVDDDFIHRASPSSRVEIEIEYLDNNTDQFNLHYDAGSALSPSEDWFKPTDMITKTGTNTFKTAVFILEDIYFGNRTNGADFRLTDNADGPETIRSLRVTLLPAASQEIPSEATEPLTDELMTMVFRNGVVLTMEGEETATSLIVKGDTILAVGNEKDMLDLAGSDPIVIDLQGRTLIPGFVDAHSHILNNPWRGDLIGGQDLLLSHGITTSAELFVEEELVLDLQELDSQGNLRVRTSLYLVHVDNCGGIRGDWYSKKYPVSKEPGAMLQIPGIKIFNDGGSCNAPAVSYDYPGNIGKGDLYFQAQELSTMIIEAQRLGYQVAIHSLGDRAIDTNLDAIEIALAGGPNTNRHRIEHNTVIRDDMLSRYSEVDPVLTIFGHFPSCIYQGGTSSFKFSTPEEYLFMEWRWRDLLDTNPNLHVAWHSDTPYSIGADTIAHLHSLVTRIQLRDDGSACQPPEWAADDRVKVTEALRMMTIEGAYALNRDHEIGSLAPGKLADLVLLSANPLEVAPEELASIEVLMTLVGGRIEYCHPDAIDLCLE